MGKRDDIDEFEAELRKYILRHFSNKEDFKVEEADIFIERTELSTIKELQREYLLEYIQSSGGRKRAYSYIVKVEAAFQGKRLIPVPALAPNGGFVLIVVFDGNHPEMVMGDGAPERYGWGEIGKREMHFKKICGFLEDGIKDLAGKDRPAKMAMGFDEID